MPGRAAAFMPLRPEEALTEHIAVPNAPARKRLWNRPILLLATTSLIWAGHSVVGKLAVGEIPPMTLTFLRWAFAFVPICFAARHVIVKDFKVLRRHWPYVLSLGALGYTAFNSLFYLSAHYTGALNMALFQACIPGLVLIGAALGFGARPKATQAFGAACTMAGVAVIAAQGQFARLASLSFNFGDVLMFVACVFYAYYALALRYRPAVSSIGFLAGVALAALLTSIPPFLWEISRTGFVLPGLRGWAVVLYASLGVAFLSQLCFMRGVQLIGPGRAGVFVNLVPVFGALMAVGFLGEPLASYHLVALALVIGGIVLAQR